ncbi:LysR family transcriptional regulator [Dermacoccaceae bacterium W4C1]
MYDVQRLRALHAVSQQGSVVAAADRLGFTPSAVSQQISKLEHQVGRPLLEKAGRGVVLTDAGRLLAESAESILQITERTHARLEEMQNRTAGTLRVQCFSSGIRGLLGPALQTLADTDPELRIEVREYGDDPIPGVLGGHVDLTLALDWTSTRLPIPSGLVRMPIALDQADILLHADHPRAQSDSLRFADISAEPWIGDGGSDSICTAWLRNAVSRSGCSLDLRHRVDDFSAQVALVSAGMGISLMPRMGRPPLPDNVRAVPVNEDPPVRQIFGLCRASSQQRPSMLALMRELRNAANDPAVTADTVERAETDAPTA